MLLARAAIFVGCVVGGLLFVTGWRRLGAGLAGLLLAGYAAVVILPASGLPARLDALAPPRFMHWLADGAGTEYRTLGITPDFSSVGGIQDLGVVGPFSPRSYANFIHIVAPDHQWRNFQRIGTFWVTTGFLVREYYDLGDYLRAKPVFDWLGVRYVVLDRESLREGKREDHVPLVAGAAGLRVAYEDERVMVVESPTAAPKAEFWTSARVLPDSSTIVQAIRADPALVLGRPLLASSPVVDRLGLDWGEVRMGGMGAQAASEAALPATVEVYGPNRVRLAVDAPGPGLLVLKDAAAPGWQASLDGADAEIVEVHAMVRGIAVPTAGRHAVELVYRPVSLIWGLAVSAACALAVAALAIRAHVGQPSMGWSRRGTMSVRHAFLERGA